ncbi:TonB-dependent receptor [Neolewinella sp.]|uniref:TonB-dependent receptor n=1 Tax=Neolewinella sp. TaxID=2993543 RepID=UPI003B51A5CC
MEKILTLRGTLLCALLFLFGFIQAQETASITGTVLSDSDDDRLEGASVALQNTSRGAITDGEGQFVLENLSPGDYTVVVSSIGFESITRPITLRANEERRLTFELRTSQTLLSEITIRGAALDPRNRTITVNEVDREQIQTLNLDLPIRIIEQVPGVDLLSYNQGGVADQFSIRGFGGGGHEGQAGAQIDGVSLNEAEGHSDGYADLNILIPLNLETVKVYKGPSSVLFGRFAEGGTLAMETRKGGNYQDVSITGGSFNTLNAQFALGKSIDLGRRGTPLQTNLAFQFFQSDGYAANSNNLRGNLTGRVAYQLTDKTDVALSLRGHRSQWDAAGYISEARVNDRRLRTTQEVNAENDGGAKQFYSQKLDINHTFNDSLRLLVFGYAVQQEFTRFAKFGLSSGGQTERFNTRTVYATGASLNGSNQLGTVDLNWIAGAEFYTEGTERMRWRTSQRVRGEQILDRNFDVQTLSAYAQAEFSLSRYLRPSIGLRYDKFYGSFNSNDPGQPSFSNEIGQLSHVTPKLGLRSTVVDGVDIRVSASNGFSLPNSALKYERNLVLKPVTLWQYELGAGYTGIDWLELDVVGYILNTSNEILESPPGSGDFVNVGKTERTGIETEAVVKPVAGLRVRGTFSYTETEVMTNPEASLLGKALVNIPQTIATFDVSYALRSGLGGRFMLRDVGHYFTNADNSAGYDGYTVANLTFFYNFNEFSANRGRIFVEVRNVFDTLYSETVFGDVGSQIFTPAPTRNLMVGVNYNF